MTGPRVAETCSRCHGVGSVLGYLGPFSDHDPKPVACGQCGGTGRIGRLPSAITHGDPNDATEEALRVAQDAVTTTTGAAKTIARQRDTWRASALAWAEEALERSLMMADRSELDAMRAQLADARRDAESHSLTATVALGHAQDARAEVERLKGELGDSASLYAAMTRRAAKLDDELTEARSQISSLQAQLVEERGRIQETLDLADRFNEMAAQGAGFVGHWGARVLQAVRPLRALSQKPGGEK